VRPCTGETLSLPCLQTVWNGSGLCTFHEKIAGGLLEPSEPGLRPPGWRQARRPEMLSGDGWVPADALSQMFCGPTNSSLSSSWPGTGDAASPRPWRAARDWGSRRAYNVRCPRERLATHWRQSVSHGAG
jgi:hypothetical protein